MASDPTKVLDEIEQWAVKGDPVHKTAEDAFRHIDQCKARVRTLVAIARAVGKLLRHENTERRPGFLRAFADDESLGRLIDAYAKLVE